VSRHVPYVIRFIVFLVFFSVIAVAGFLVYTGYNCIISSSENSDPVSSGMITSGIAGGSIDYRDYVTPDSPVIKELASKMTIEQAYDLANDWIYISEQQLHGVMDKWILPEEFLTGSPDMSSNPVPGEIVGDCEEQANTLVSLIRATGCPPEDVRVALGVVSTDKINRGHVWVELYRDGCWLALDPSQGPRWNEVTNNLERRVGMDFLYYSEHKYPVSLVTAYYNDRYYFEYGQDHMIDEVPDIWNTDKRGYELTSR
jgi:hypothetical protein